jgi:hypothetical protein
MKPAYPGLKLKQNFGVQEFIADQMRGDATEVFFGNLGGASRNSGQQGDIKQLPWY